MINKVTKSDKSKEKLFKYLHIIIIIAILSKVLFVNIELYMKVCKVIA